MGDFGGGYDEGTIYNPGNNISFNLPPGTNTTKITANPITQVPTTAPIAPTVVVPTPPVVTTPPPVANEYQGQNYYVNVVEGIRTHAGDFKTVSSGALHPALIQVDGAQSNGTWSGLMGLATHDGGPASCTTADGVSSTFAASGFDFSTIPPDATILGIKVTVKRRKF